MSFVLRGGSIAPRAKEEPQDSNSGVGQGCAYETGLFCLRKHRGVQLLEFPAGTSLTSTEAQRKREENTFGHVWEPLPSSLECEFVN